MPGRDSLKPALWTRPDGEVVEWRVSAGLTPYADAVSLMEERVEAIAAGAAREQVWLLEHPPLYTAGTSASDADLLHARFPVHQTGRGGQYTYHGPGQRIAYVMLDLRRRRPDVRAFVAALGIRLRRWVSFHGVAVNVAPDLAHFSGIAPCGVRQAHFGVTSLAELGVEASMRDVDATLAREFEAIFGQIEPI